jgi:integrase
VVTQYKADPRFQNLQPKTKKAWAPWLDRIIDDFGNVSIANFDRPQKIRPLIRQWRNKWSDRPRTADVAMQVLSRVLSYAVEIGKLAGNPCEGIERLYKADRSGLIWTDADLAEIKKFCSAEIVQAIDLAAHTGLRLGDLVRLCWSHVHEDRIEITTNKSKHKQEAIIPLYDALRDVLSRIPKRSPVILTNSLGRPWASADALGNSFTAAKANCPAQKHLHFHDLRGTAATRFYVAGLPERVIAEILGWEETSVAKIIRKYVDRSAAVKAIIRQLNESK